MKQVLCLLMCILLAGAATPAGAIQYSVTGLGADPLTGPYATDINESAEITGRRGTLPFQEAFTWDSGLTTVLAPLSGFTGSEGLGINDLGRVVGNSSGGPVGIRAVLWENGTPTDLGSLTTGDGSSAASAINNAGVIAAGCSSARGWEACFRENGVWYPLGQWIGVWSHGEDINENNEVVGAIQYSDGRYCGFIFDSSQVFYPLTEFLFLDSYAYAINNQSRIVGFCSNGTNEACIWEYGAGGPVILMGTLPGAATSEARDINDRDEVVGFSGNRPFIWGRYTGMKDLNDMLDSSGTGWTLTAAWAINDQGQIAGVGSNPSGYQEPFLLTPVGNADGDGDGYPYYQDCDDSDPGVNPGAAEVKHDGVDQDCNGYDLTIEIIKARYNSGKFTLTVEATSDYGEAAELRLADFYPNPMTWVANKNKWTKTVKNVYTDPVTVRVFGPEGEEIGYTGDPPCEPVPEVCDDGVDNDCDGLVDTDDPECPSQCNGNGVCDPGEDCLSCPDECDGKLKGKPSSQFCCGNGILEPPEEDGTVCGSNY